MPRRKGRRGGERRGSGGQNSKKLKPTIISAQEIESGIAFTSTVTLNPFTVLPKEIYLKIFDKLDDPNDKESFMNAHTKWYNLFKTDRPLFLFGKVLKALAQNGNGLDMCHFMTFNDSNGLHDKDYLDLRKVCKSWDASLQKHLQLHPFHFQPRKKEEEKITVLMDRKIFTLNSEREWFINKIFQCDSESHLKTSLERMLVTHPPSRNPFLSRKIRADFRFLTTQEKRAQLSNLLETYGHHVWHFEFSFLEKVTLDSFCQVVKWLSLMPELKTLHMDGDRLCDYIYTDEEIRDIDNLSVELPEMKKLSVIKWVGLVPAAFNKLVSGIKGPLQKLLISNKNEENKLSFYNLPSTVKVANVLVGGIEELNHVKGFGALRKLTIEFKKGFGVLRKLGMKSKVHFDTTEWPEWDVTLKFVEETFPELEELSLCLPYFIPSTKSQAQSLSCRLNLLKLKKLRVILPHLASLDFILPLKELKELQVVMGFWYHLSQADELGRKEIIKINMYFERMWESNIWQVLPKLKKLHIAAIASPKMTTEGDCMTNLYGYVKKGGDKKFISFIPSRSPSLEVSKLFYKSQGYI